MISTRLRRHLSVLTAVTATAAATLTASPASTASTGETVEVSGPVRTVVIEGAEKSRIAQSLQLPDGRWVTVEPDSEVPPSAEVRGVLSTRDGATMDLAVDAVRPVAAASGALAHRAYVAYVTSVGSYQALPPEALTAKVAAAGAFWARESDGAIPAFPVETTVPFASQVAKSSAGCGLMDGYDALWAEAAALFPTVDFDAPGNHLVVALPDECEFTGRGGIGTLGTGLGGGGRVAVRIEESSGLYSLVHELGHNFGLMHANAMTCSSADTCVRKEYFDYHDVMSGSINGLRDSDPTALPALSSLNRRDLGLLTSDETARVTLPSDDDQRSTTFRIRPRSDSEGLRTVAITDPDRPDRTYYVDYRSGTGRDARTYYTDRVLQDGIFGIRFGPGVTILTDDGAHGTDLWTRPLGDASHRAAWDAGQTFSSVTGSVSVVVDDVAPGQYADVTVTVSSDLRPLVPTASPRLTGRPTVVDVLTVDPGTWPPDTRLSYRWFLDGVVLPVERPTSSLQLGWHMRGGVVHAEVTATRSGYRPAVVTTNSLGPVTNPVQGGAAVIVDGDDVVVGDPLQGQFNTYPEDATTALQWQVDGVPVPGATGLSYTPTLDDVGGQVTLSVHASAPGFDDAVLTSEPVGPVLAAARMTPATPTLSDVAVGRAVQVSSGGWPSGTTLAFRWLLDGAAAGTGRRFVPQGDAVGRLLTVEVTGTHPTFATTTVVSAPRRVAEGTLRAPRPRVSGAPLVGRILRVQPGAWPSGTTLHYQWYADGRPLRGATAPGLRLTSAHRGARVQVTVTGTKAGYAPATARSRASVPVR